MKCWFMMPLLVLLLAAAEQPKEDGTTEGLASAVQALADQLAAFWQCNFSIAVHHNSGAAAAAASPDGRGLVTPGDRFVWGSVTKMLTAAQVLRLSADGHFGLDDKVAPLLDPFLARHGMVATEGGPLSLEKLFGADANQVTVRQLLSMGVRIPDFDTAVMIPGHPAKDSLRQVMYNEPNRSLGPFELLDFPWVKNRPVGACQPDKVCYSSTNYVLLGLLLASQLGLKSWTSLDQRTFVPDEIAANLVFAKTGPPSQYTDIHGLDVTSYNMPENCSTANHDVWEVSGVFAGWTASDLVGTPAAVAALALEIYGPRSRILPRKFAKEMVPKGHRWYGMGTFSLSGFVDDSAPERLREGYGHLGSTYGYQSAVFYHPALEFTIAIGTTMETNGQYQTVAGLRSVLDLVMPYFSGKGDVKVEVNTDAHSGFFGFWHQQSHPLLAEQSATRTLPIVGFVVAGVAAASAAAVVTCRRRSSQYRLLAVEEV